MLEAVNVGKVYGMGKVTLSVLKDVSLRVAPGRFMAITGPSGAGKSTLLHLLAGLDTPTTGDVLWEGRLISTMSDAKRAAFRNRVVGIVFQFYHLLSDLSALENVMLPGLVNGHRGGRKVRARALACLHEVRLGERLHHRPRELSGGEQQRVAIARALINEPKVLLCDEPTGNLDSAAGAEIAALLQAIHRRADTSIVLVTHDAQLAQHADETVVLRDGALVAK